MAAPKGSSDSGSTAVIVMIIFIVLFLISSGLAIAFYVNIEKSNKRADDALARLNKFGSTTQISEIEKLAESSGLESGSTTDKLTAVIGSFSDAIIGKNASGFSLSAAKAKIDSSLDGLWTMIAEVQGKDPETDLESVKSLGLAGATRALIAQLETIYSEFVAYQEQSDNQLLLNQQTIDRYEQRISQLQSDIDSLGSSVANMKNSTNENIDDLTSRFQSQVAALQSDKDQIIQATEEYRNQLDAELRQAELLSEKTSQLEKFLRETRQKPTMELEALDPDGTVISVDSSEQMVYIDLSESDKIYRGLTFTVYDGFENTIPSSGRGKATIEVVEIMDTISRCRVVENLSSTPIMKNDIIANLVWDKDRQFIFCVVGEFDFNMDGEVDVDGYDRIVALITGWGGKIENSVNVNTDFLVYGEKPSVDNIFGTESVEEKANIYNRALDEGVRLGVPAFNKSRFFRFIGYSSKQVVN